ncbi:transglycosylase domain-containing protein [Paenibacillus tengchongensis]|uniref:transglycosylase domain-containing protein n=1 Tax=Paenibacillus tengchongensis TaxID=2608684 RepID=UPI00124D41D0|nr:PBP1A family penicillin-binding protein [Paenibacillus tengchongensis]
MSARHTAAVRRRFPGRAVYLGFDLAVLGTLLVFALLFYVNTYGQSVISRTPERLVLPESSVVLSADGAVLRRIPLPGSGYRSLAGLNEMPELLIQTFLTVEDRQFYAHSGLNYTGIARAAVRNTLSLRIAEGGSSITQQLARNLYLDRRQTLLRKLNEASIALALEKRMSKDKILELYLNQIYMGRGQYGVKTAAEYYFGVTDLRQLDIGQIAALAATPKGPSIYNPAENNAVSAARQQLVLRIMEQQGLITAQERAQAARTEYHPPQQPAGGVLSGASYIDVALQEAARLTGRTPEQLKTGGYRIQTAMNAAAQEAMEWAFRERDNFPPDGLSRQVEAAMVIMDQHSGEIAALIGGRDESPGSVNRAVIDARQPGSAFKPVIVYGPALESGMYSPDSILPDRKQNYGGYSPDNVNGVYRGQVSMRTALRESINAPAVWLLKQVGIAQARQFAAKLGIQLPAEDVHLSIALGGLHQGVSPLKMAQAYSVFASGGIYREAHTVRSISAAGGQLLYRYEPEPQRVITAQTADSMTRMLRSAVNEGTGKKARLSVPVAGKTGTTQAGLPGVSGKANRDLWFVGYTPDWTAAVWMGFDRTDKEHVLYEGSGKAAALFAAVMSKVEGGP